MAPALPYNGRVIRGGVAFVNGTPLAETEFASDPFSPLPDSRVAALIGRQSVHPVALLGLDTVRGAELPASLRELRERGSRIVVADAESEADLAAIAAAVYAGAGCLACGSAGLFDQLRPLVAREAGGPAAAGRRRAAAARAPIIVLSGSPSRVSKEQVRRAAADGRAVLLPLDGGAADGRERQAELERVARLAEQAVRAGSDVVVDAAGAGKAEILAAHGGDARAMAEASGRVQAALSALLARLLAGPRPGGLVLFGGDTALNACRTLGIAGIRIEAEAEPFVPAGIALGGQWDGLPLVTKAGGFGGERVIENALRLLRPGV